MLDREGCYRALLARDSRFDGLFFTGVKTTGVYCRPVCSARTPREDRCEFFTSSAQAEKAGFRACFRCRPELAPGQAPQDAVPHLVARAVARIEQGFLNENDIERLSDVLGVTSRHLRRSMQTELGVTPVELAQSRRLAMAKQLLQDTGLGLAEIAFESGFGSVRRFNAAFHARFGRSPSALRRRHGSLLETSALTLRLDFRPPFDWEALLDFLARRAIPGVETVEGGLYRRTVRLAKATGLVEVRRDPTRTALQARISLSAPGQLTPLAAKLRALFDLDAAPDAIGRTLARDPEMARRVEARPGLRVPGAFDPFEAAARAILGQQVTVAAARTIAGRLVRRFGEELPGGSGLTHLFPSSSVVARSSVDVVAGLGMPGNRAKSLLALAQAFASGRLDSARDEGLDALTERLRALPGVGEWTAQVIAMRAFRLPDAFPVGDLGIVKALGSASPREALARAELWRPYRAYAVMHLWSSDPKGDPR